MVSMFYWFYMFSVMVADLIKALSLKLLETYVMFSLCS